MNLPNSDEIDAWLYEVETVSKKVLLHNLDR
jgi:hypothetical protein